jgi:hypothetical protein
VLGEERKGKERRGGGFIYSPHLVLRDGTPLIVSHGRLFDYRHWEKAAEGDSIRPYLASFEGSRRCIRRQKDTISLSCFLSYSTKLARVFRTDLYKSNVTVF